MQKVDLASRLDSSPNSEILNLQENHSRLDNFSLFNVCPISYRLFFYPRTYTRTSETLGLSNGPLADKPTTYCGSDPLVIVSAIQKV
jgi:hypothetical protein